MNTSSDKNLPDLPLSFDNDQTVETEKLFTSLSSLALVAACTLSRVNSLNTRQFEYLLTWWLINYYKNDRNAKYNWSAKSWPFKMKIACVASVSVGFRRKERGTRVKDREKSGASKRALVSFLARSKPKVPFLGISLLRNQTEMLATQAKMKRNLAPIEIAVVDMTTVHFAWTYPNPLGREIWITITLS